MNLLESEIFRRIIESDNKISLLEFNKMKHTKKQIPKQVFDSRDYEGIECEFVYFLITQIELHPELIVEADEAQLARIANLVKGVEDDS